MSQSTLISIVLAVIIIAIFLVDYLKKRKEDPLEKSVEKFVEKESETKERSGVLNWIINRKKNITASILLILFFKVIVHFFWFPHFFGYMRQGSKKNTGFGFYLENIFSLELRLFIPITLVFLIVVWFFNDKIKAQ